MENDSTLTLDRIFKSKEFEAKTFGPARWMKDESAYMTLEPADDEEKVKEIVQYDTQSGERIVLVSAAQLQPAGTDKPLIIKSFDWSAE